MSTVKPLYGTQGVGFTCTVTNLANATGPFGAGRQSTAVDNRTNLFTNVLVAGKVKTSASALANDKTVYVWAYGTANDGTDYTDGVAGTDGSFTAANPPNLRPLGTIPCPSTGTIFEGGPWALEAAFGGVVPALWGIVVVNFTGQTLDASVGSFWYQGQQGQVV